MNDKPTTVIAPPSTPPTQYVLHKRTQKCACCGSLHEFTDVYSQHNLPSNWNKTSVKNLRPCQRPEFNLPIEIIALPLQELPFCHECVMRLSLSHLPPPPREDRLNRTTALGEGLAAAVERKTKKQPATIDDIFSQIGK